MLRSLRARMVLWIFIFLLPIFLMLSICMNQITRSYEQSMNENFHQILAPYAAGIDATLNAAKRYLATEQFSLDFMDKEKVDSLETLRQLENINERLLSALATQNQIDALFFYKGGRLLFVQNYNTSYRENLMVSEQLKILLPNTPDTKGAFQSLEVDSKLYFYLWYPAENGIVGCWLSGDGLLSSAREAELRGAKEIFFSDSNHIPLSSPADGTAESWEQRKADCSISYASLESASYSLSALWENDVIYQALRQVEELTVMVLLFSVLLFILYLMFLHRSLFSPMNRLIANIDRLKTELSDQLPADLSESVEFGQIYEALNRMLGEIRHLRIHVYEEKLSQQHTQMELYQLQVRPHFFVNTLQTIQCFTKAHQLEKAEAMAEMLVKHCQYVLYSNWMVTLDEELNFIDNYVKLRALQNNKEYRYEVDCPDSLLDEEIPILLIQIFVENALKYAQPAEGLPEIRLKISCLDREDGPFLHILLTDNGSGLSGEILAKLQSGKDLHRPGQRRGIGIDNVRQRLQLIYGSTAVLRFFNGPEGGASVEICLPIRREEGEEL